MEQWKEYLDLYLKHKKALKLAPRTIDDSRYHVTNLFKGKDIDFSDFRGLKNLITGYFADSDNISPVTFNTRRKNLNTFFNWLIEEEYINKSPMKSIKKVREDHKPKHVSLDVIVKLLNACDRKTYNGLRDYISIALCFDTGVRPSEMMKLLYSDFDLEHKQFTVRAEVSKTRISRELPLNDILIPLIQELNHHHIKAHWEKDIPLLANEDKTPLDRFSWRRRVITYSEIIGIHVTPYMIRHTAAYTMLKNKANAFHVQSMLGHTNLNTTKIYINLALSDLQEVHKETSPLSRVI
jgi:integrase